MTTKTEALKLALEALETIYASTYPYREDGSSTLSDESVQLSNKAIAKCREALAQPEPVSEAYALADSVRQALDRKSCPGAFMDTAWESIVKEYRNKIYTSSPAREWVGLTPTDFEKLEKLYGNKVSNGFVFADIICSIEALSKEKNT